MMILEGIRVSISPSTWPTHGRATDAEMGAEIIKIEIAPGGDPSRLLPIADDGRSGYFVQQNRGKKSVALDLARPEADAIVASWSARRTSSSRISARA